MPDPGAHDALDALDARVLTLLDARDATEVAEGHQARVLRVRRAGGDVIAKLIDPTMTERAQLEVRVALVEALADLHPDVCRPLRVGERLVTGIELDGASALLVCVELADGRTLDAMDPADAHRMGVALRDLHVAMRMLPPGPLPTVHAFRTAPAAVTEGLGPTQLLHGDFSTGNLRLTPDGVVRIFDFEDCGYGPPELDVANAIWMVLFDALVSGKRAAASAFRAAFLDGYGGAIDDAGIDRLLDARVDALAGWLADLSTAPIGVRTSSDEWRDTLASVVTAYRALQR